MIELRSVYSLFRERYGDENDENTVKSFCFTAAMEIGNTLRRGADEKDIRVLGAAAALANYRMLLRRYYSFDPVTQFKAGDVTVSMKPEQVLESAKSECLQALYALSPLTVDREFLFRQVRV